MKPPKRPPPLCPQIPTLKRLPFAVQAPNITTVKAMKELDEGKGKRFVSAEELFQDLGD
ncbi:MAG: type II toxin-antitoxin system RelB/DinJ family antitoxin [Gemmatimonadota bacterium]|nr:type II toxin-antitoxin system RelB/DinJ family antitoxin [Gemmatimonadota bacterium]